MRSPDELVDLFRSTGRKVTAQRQCIFRILQGDVTHPSAESVFDVARAEMETISLKTVYQTLYELAELGEVAVLDVGTGMTRFDPNVATSHYHLVCQSCGKVRDLDADLPALGLPDGPVQGYRVHSAEVVLRGLCQDCEAARANDQRSRHVERRRAGRSGHDAPGGRPRSGRPHAGRSAADDP